MRRILLTALAASAALATVAAPSASAEYGPDVVGCVLENRIGFPYGGYDVDPVRTVLCLRG